MRFPRTRSQSSKKFTPVLIGGLLIVSTLLSPQSAKASITITSNEAEAFAYDAFAGGTIQNFNGTSIPTSTVLNAVDGATFSKNIIDWSASGGQTILSFDMEHQRTGVPGSYARTFNNSLKFTAGSDATYTLSGFYNVTDVGASESGYVFQAASLRDTSSGYLFVSYNESVDTHNEQFTLGTIGGDGGVDFVNGSLVGNLIAGHSYEFTFSADIIAAAIFDSGADSGARAVGNFTLMIGEASTGVVPEPMSLFVWGGLIVGAAVRRHSHAELL